MSGTSLNHTSNGNLPSLLYKMINDSLWKSNTSASNISAGDNLMSMSSMPLSSLYIAWLSVAATIFIPGVLANGMILLALFKVEKLRVASNYLIGSLAVADLMMMFGMAGFIFSDLFKLDISRNVNKFLWPSFDLLIGSASIINLAGVSFDRATAVFNPLLYHERSNLGQTVFTIKCIWGYSLLLYVFSMLRCVIEAEAYRLTVLYVSYIFSFILPFGVIIVSYTLILSATIKNVKLSRSVERAVYNAAMRLNDEPSLKFARIRKLRIQEIKIAGNFIIILLPFVGCWGFFFGTHFYEDITKTSKRSDLYEWFLITLPWISSSINPLIYILSVSSLRNGCKKLLCKGRYLARARETIITTLQSKRSSAVDRGLYQVPAEKKSLLQRLSLSSAFTRKAKPNADQEVDAVRKTDSAIGTSEEKQFGENNFLMVKLSTVNGKYQERVTGEKINISIV